VNPSHLGGAANDPVGQRRHHLANPGHRAHGVHRARAGAGLNRLALSATLHCLTGCSIGEVAGMVIGIALGLGNVETVLLAVALAFVSGYAFTAMPLMRAGIASREVARIALAADTASIAVMEIADNLIMWTIPGAMDAGIDSGLFWMSMAIALAVGGVAAYPINRWLIARGRGHALAHTRHRATSRAGEEPAS
jgi:hypothetical protein